MGTSLMSIRIASVSNVKGNFFRATDTRTGGTVYVPIKHVSALKAGDVVEMRFWWVFTPHRNELGDEVMKPLANNEPVPAVRPVATS
jgi:hypothetical protein